MAPRKLTEEQKGRLRVLEPALKQAAARRDYKRAKEITLSIQNLLRPTGHETRLMQAKNWLFETAMEVGELNTAIQGFIGVRQKVSARTRVYLEATSLLAICYLRQKNLQSARPFMVEALKNVGNITSEARKSEYKVSLAKRFEDEALLASIAQPSNDYLDPQQIQDEAGKIVYSKHEDEILEALGGTVPEGALDFVDQVHKESVGLLSYDEKQKLPSPAQFVERKKLGKGILAAFQSVIWHSLCDKHSDVYKMWSTNGMEAVFDKRYLTSAIVATLTGLSIGIYAIAVYITALIIKLGIEVFCTMYKPVQIMELRK
ncbi:MAG: hypothetical protein AB2598_02300 [Candidatus Thiodiazotropha sp.]